MFIRESELAHPAGRPIDREAEDKWVGLVVFLDITTTATTMTKANTNSTHF